MSRIYCLLLFLASTAVMANGETLYVRPASSCPNNGNGTAYACASSAGGVGAWTGLLVAFNDAGRVATTNTVGKVDPGDTLYICGAHNETFIFGDSGGTLGDGSSTQHIKISWLCPSDPGSINGAPNNYGFYSEHNWLDIESPNVSGGVLQPFYMVRNNSDAEVRNIKITGGTIGGCTNSGTACLQVLGQNITVDGTTINKGPALNDSINIRGKNNVVKNITCNLAANVGAPCIQLEGQVDGTLVENVTCNHNQSNGSTCVAANLITDGGTITVRGNKGTIGTGNLGAFIDLDTSAIVENNIARGGGIGGIRIISSAATTYTVRNNNFQGPVSLGNIIIGGNITNATITGNIILGTPTIPCIFSGTQAAGVSFTNNRMAYCATGIAEDTASPNNVDSGNYYHTTVTTRVRKNFIPATVGPSSRTYTNPPSMYGQ